MYYTNFLRKNNILELVKLLYCTEYHNGRFIDDHEGYKVLIKIYRMKKKLYVMS